MVKFFVLLGTLLVFTSPVFANLPTDASIIQVHDMQMIRDQQFRMNELNDYNDVQTEKARYEKRNNSNPKPLVQKLFNKKKFVEEDGKIKIQSEN